MKCFNNNDVQVVVEVAGTSYYLPPKTTVSIPEGATQLPKGVRVIVDEKQPVKTKDSKRK